MSVTYDRTVVLSRYSGFLHQKKLPLRYNWNIVESDFKHHSPNPNFTSWNPNKLFLYIYITYHSSPQFRLCLTMNFKKENGRVILAIYVLVSCTLPSWICLSENDPQLCCFTDSWVTTVIRVGYIKTRFCARASV